MAGRSCSARFGAADTMYAPVVLRCHTYGVGLAGGAAGQSAGNAPSADRHPNSLVPDAWLRLVRSALNREVDDLDATDQILERHVADRTEHATVARIVEVVAQHEIIACR